MGEYFPNTNFIFLHIHKRSGLIKLRHSGNFNLYVNYRSPQSWKAAIQLHVIGACTLYAVSLVKSEASSIVVNVKISPLVFVEQLGYRAFQSTLPFHLLKSSLTITGKLSNSHSKLRHGPHWEEIFFFDSSQSKNGCWRSSVDFMLKGRQLKKL